MERFGKSKKLDKVRYEIRGAVHKEALKLEQAGHKLIKLNIGNPAPFGFQAPAQILQHIKENLEKSQGYAESNGILTARLAIYEYYRARSFPAINPDDVYIGNGVSELISMCMISLLDDGDEILIPSPDYPLWTAAATLAGGKVVHYLCDEADNWSPDIADIRQKITARTKAIVVINPNNPTGAVYTKERLEAIAKIADEHSLMIFSDEIYEKIIYDEAKHYHIAPLAKKVPVITFNGLSKSYVSAGFRQGWLIISGDKSNAQGFIEGLDTLSSMRLCATVPMQHGIKAAFEGYQAIDDLIAVNGRLRASRDTVYQMLNAIEGVVCNKAAGALYSFFKIDPSIYDFASDEQLVFDFLREEKVLLVHGSGFNYPSGCHFRIVALAEKEMLQEAITRLERFLQKRKK